MKTPGRPLEYGARVPVPTGFAVLPPLTVRDGIGYAFDAAMTPYTYLFRGGDMAGQRTSIVNERSLNLDRFERVAESTVDLYGAVRNAYLQRRAAAIKQ